MVAAKLSIAQAAAGRKRQQRRLGGFNVAARLGPLCYGDGSSGGSNCSNSATSATAEILRCARRLHRQRDCGDRYCKTADVFEASFGAALLPFRESI